MARSLQPSANLSRDLSLVGSLQGRRISGFFKEILASCGTFRQCDWVNKLCVAERSLHSIARTIYSPVITTWQRSRGAESGHLFVAKQAAGAEQLWENTQLLCREMSLIISTPGETTRWRGARGQWWDRQEGGSAHGSSPHGCLWPASHHRQHWQAELRQPLLFISGNCR